MSTARRLERAAAFQRCITFRPTVNITSDRFFIAPRRGGISETPIRRRIFTCRPTNPSEELPCATKILTELARQAYRRPINADDMEGLMTFYEQGRKEGNFESGIRFGLQAILASLDFVFR